MPDATAPFLTEDLIKGWITVGINALRAQVQDQLHEFDKGQLHVIHKLQKLAGDGEQDIGAVARVETLVTEYIRENRAASTKASEERQRVEEQIKRWKMIPVFTRNLWKIIAAVAGLALGLMTLWTFFHPQPVVLTPQQMQEIRKSR